MLNEGLSNDNAIEICIESTAETAARALCGISTRAEEETGSESEAEIKGLDLVFH